MINRNLEIGDIAITFEFEKDTSESVRRKQFHTLIRNLRKNYRAAGYEMEYVAANNDVRVELLVNRISDVSTTMEMMRGTYDFTECKISAIKTNEQLEEVVKHMEEINKGKYYISKGIAKSGIHPLLYAKT